GTRAERSQIGAGPRLRESLAPELLPRQEGWNEAAALGLAAVTEERGADQVDVGRGRRARRAHLVQRLIEEPALDGRRGAPTVLARPGDGGPAAGGEEPLPGARHLEPERLLDPGPAMVSPPARGEVRLEPAARLRREAELRGREREVHGRYEVVTIWPMRPRVSTHSSTIAYMTSFTDRTSFMRPTICPIGVPTSSFAPELSTCA